MNDNIIQYIKHNKILLGIIILISIIIITIFSKFKTIEIYNKNSISAFIFSDVAYILHSYTLNTEFGNIYLKPFDKISIVYSPYIGSDVWDEFKKNWLLIYEFKHDLMLLGKRIDNIEKIYIELHTHILIDTAHTATIEGEEYLIYEISYSNGSDEIWLTGRNIYIKITFDGKILEYTLMDG